ncbi:MAG: hypothetical protein IPK19_06670 [Chloroflexi bacterium]|nr:hypothetical protein [Chloroflexota bacterium]
MNMANAALGRLDGGAHDLILATARPQRFPSIGRRTETWLALKRGMSGDQENCFRRDFDD